MKTTWDIVKIQISGPCLQWSDSLGLESEPRNLYFNKISSNSDADGSWIFLCLCLRQTWPGTKDTVNPSASFWPLEIGISFPLVGPSPRSEWQLGEQSLGCNFSLFFPFAKCPCAVHNLHTICSSLVWSLFLLRNGASEKFSFKSPNL